MTAGTCGSRVTTGQESHAIASTSTMEKASLYEGRTGMLSP
jgi:hypothetical protein